MSSPGDKKPDATPKTGRRNRARASKACLVCRQRKVRCQVVRAGKPCLNCALDNEACIVIDQGGRGTLKTKRKGRPRRDYEEALRNDSGLPFEPSLIEGLDVMNEARHSPGSSVSDGVPSPKVGLARENSTAREFEFQDIMTPQNAALASSLLNATPIVDPNQQQKLRADVPFSAYSFIVVSNLHMMAPEDINYLDMKGCFRVPAREILDEFIEQYFRYIHPFLPLIHEGIFWDMYSGPSDATSTWTPRIPLLILKSMLFASCSFVSAETLKKLGHGSIRAAREAMYQQAKALFHLDTEPSGLHITQAALLLSHYSPSKENATNRPSSAWLGVAIQSAKSMKAHKWHAVTSSGLGNLGERQRQMSLKRLWACCIVRDRVLSLSLRRTCQVTREDVDANSTFPLSSSDLSTESYRSKVYDSSVKRVLAEAFLRFGDLCLILADMSSSLFPHDRGYDLENVNKQDEKLRLYNLQANFDQWFDCTGKRMSETMAAQSNATVSSTDLCHPSVTMFTNLMYTYYYSCRIAVANLDMLEAVLDLESHANTVNAIYEEVRFAVLGANRCMKKMVETQVVQYLPFEVFPCAALPMALEFLHRKLSVAQQQKVPETDCFIHMIRSFDALYDGVKCIGETIKTAVGQKPLLGLIAHLALPKSNRTINWGLLATSDPLYYVRLVSTMDLGFCQGRMPEERDYPMALQQTFHRPATYNDIVQHDANSFMPSVLSPSQISTWANDSAVHMNSDEEADAPAGTEASVWTPMDMPPPSSGAESTPWKADAKDSILYSPVETLAMGSSDHGLVGMLLLDTGDHGIEMVPGPGAGNGGCLGANSVGSLVNEHFAW